MSGAPDRGERRREQLATRLRHFRAPAEREAGERALAVVLAALDEREAVSRRRPPRRAMLAAAFAALAAILTLTPAGASMREWIERAVSTPGERPAALRLPAAGSILATAPEGTWIVREDGSRRLLGPFREAAFSPRGINVAVASGRELAALSANGDLRWSLTAPARVADPAWAPSGVRIAYRTGRQLRVVEGDGSPGSAIRRQVAPVAPAWAPAKPDEPGRDLLAWVEPAGQVRAMDPVSGEAVLSVRIDGRPRALAWLPDRSLVVAGDRELVLFAAGGARLARFAQPAGTRLTDLTATPDGTRVAVARSVSGPDRAARSELSLIRLEAGERRERTLFSGPGAIEGLAVAPDGSAIAFGWPAADSWLFITPRQTSKLIEEIEALPEITSSLRRGTDGPSVAGFPRIEAWCCGER